jgi:predicted Holliday junction resolvase-like endonuclease
MTVNLPLPFILFVACAAVLAILFLGVRLGMLIGRLRAESRFTGRIETERADAVKRSRSVLGGQFSEQIAPFLPGFPADPTEVRFIGKPVDFIAFTGSARGSVEEVVFIEVKTGSSRLSPTEKTLRDAIERGCVRYVEYRIDGKQAGEQ